MGDQKKLSNFVIFQKKSEVFGCKKMHEKKYLEIYMVIKK